MSEVPFGSLVRRTLGGGTPSRAIANFWQPEVPWASVKDISAGGRNLQTTEEGISRQGLKASTANLIEPGTPIVAMRMAVGSVATFSQQVAINQDLRALLPTEAVEATYLYYLLQSLSAKVASLAVGSTVKGIRLDQLLKLSVPEPPKPEEQRRIADLLSAIDEQIALVKVEVDKRKLQFSGLQQALLSCSKLDERDIDDVLLRQLIPTVQYGVSTSLELHGVVPVLRMNNLGSGEVDVSDLKYSPYMVRPELLLKDGDVLFNRTNSVEHVGRTSIWRSQLGEATFASYLVRLFPDENRIMKKYLVHLLNWEENQTQMRRYATPGVQQVNINPTNLRQCRVRVPRSLDTQRSIVEALDASRAYITSLTDDVEKLRWQKQGLAQDLLSCNGKTPS